MNFDAIIALFTKVGFPVAVAVWLLYRVDTLMVSWIDTQVRVAILLQQLIDMHR